MKASRIDVYGDSELVNQAKLPRMRAYRNEVSDMLGNFFNEHRVIVIPIIQNRIIDSLETVAGNFKIDVIQI